MHAHCHNADSAACFIAAAQMASTLASMTDPSPMQTSMEPVEAYLCSQLMLADGYSINSSEDPKQSSPRKFKKPAKLKKARKASECRTDEDEDKMYRVEADEGKRSRRADGAIEIGDLIRASTEAVQGSVFFKRATSKESVQTIEVEESKFSRGKRWSLRAKLRSFKDQIIGLKGREKGQGAI